MKPKPGFDEVAIRELPVLYRVARRLTLRDADAEDLVAQTLMQSARAWSAFDGRHPRSWMIRILRNEHLARIRSNAGRRELFLAEISEPAEEGFWREISWRAVGGDIIRQLDLLPEEYRLAVALCDVEDFTYEEAGRALDVPVGTIRSRLFRGRRILRARLVQLGITDGEGNIYEASL